MFYHIQVLCWIYILIIALGLLWKSKSAFYSNSSVYLWYKSLRDKEKELKWSKARWGWEYSGPKWRIDCDVASIEGKLRKNYINFWVQLLQWNGKNSV